MSAECTACRSRAWRARQTQWQADAGRLDWHAEYIARQQAGRELSS